MEFLQKEEGDDLLYKILKERIKNLSHKLEVALQERDFYKEKYEELQVKDFLSNFTVEEQVKILSEIDK